METTTIYEELPDIKNLEIGKLYLVINRDEKTISKKGKVSKNVRDVQKVTLIKESKTSFLIKWGDTSNIFSLDLFNEGDWILKQDFFNTYQIVEELEKIEKYVTTNTINE